MAITITLTDYDAEDYMDMMAERLANRIALRNRIPNDSGCRPVVPSVADVQRMNDEFNASQGVKPAVEIAPTPAETTAILESLQENNTVDTAALFGGSITGTAVEMGLALPTIAGSTAVLAPQTTIVPSPAAQSVPPAIVPIPPKLDSAGLPWDARIHSASQSINKDGTWRIKKNVEPETLTRVMAELKAVMALPAPQLPLTGVPLPPAGPTEPSANAAVTNAPPAPPLTAAEASQIPRPPRAAAETGAAASSGSAPSVPVVTTVPVSPQVSAVVPNPAGTVTAASPSETSVPTVAVPVPPVSPAASSVVIPPPPAVAVPPNIPAGYAPGPVAGTFVAPLGFGELMFKVAQAVAQGKLTKERVEAVCAEIGLPGLPMIGARPDLIPIIAQKLEIS